MSTSLKPILIGLGLAAIAVMVWIRSDAHIPVGDELRYFYSFTDTADGSYFNFKAVKPVTCFSDICHSLVNHYNHVNGRIPVHAAQYFFSAIASPRFIYPLNALILVALIAAFVRLTTRVPSSRTNPWTWLLATAMFLYLFPAPSRLWYSLNLSVNYLWPSLATVAMLLVWRRATLGAGFNSVAVKAAIVVAALLAGWSNEGFSLPLCGAMVITVIAAPRRLLGKTWWFILPLGIGCLMLIASPGNWHRASAAVDNNVASSFTTVIARLKLLWIALAAAAVAAFVNRRALVALVKANSLVVIALALAIGFGTVAHTAPRAFTGIELLAAILLGRATFDRLGSRRLALCGVLALAMLVHQGFITAEVIRQNNRIKDVVNRFVNEPTGTVAYDYREPSTALAPWVYTLKPLSRDTEYEWSWLGYSLTDGRRPIVAIDADAFDLIPKADYSTHRFVKVGNMMVSRAADVKTWVIPATDANGTRLQVRVNRFTHPADNLPYAYLVTADTTLTISY